MQEAGTASSSSRRQQKPSVASTYLATHRHAVPLETRATAPTCTTRAVPMRAKTGRIGQRPLHLVNGECNILPGCRPVQSRRRPPWSPAQGHEVVFLQDMVASVL